MITELDTDEERSQTSNLTQDDDLTFDLISGPLVNSTQTQPLATASHNSTQTTQNTNTRRNKRLSVSQHTSSEIVRSSTKLPNTQPRSIQHPSKKRPKLQPLNTETTLNQEALNTTTTAITSPISTTTISDNLEPNKPTIAKLLKNNLIYPSSMTSMIQNEQTSYRPKSMTKLIHHLINKLGPMRKSLRHSKPQLELVTLSITNYLLHQLNS